MLYERWASLWVRANGANGDVGERFGIKTFMSLMARYTEPHRHYYTVAHIGHCLLEFDAVKDLAEDPAAIEFAIWYHDAVYDTSAEVKLNVAASADLAITDLSAGGFTLEFRRRVMELIRASEKHAAWTQDEDLFCDIDLAILGQTEHRYNDYEAQIRREFIGYSPASFAAGRIAILEKFLARERIYQTEVMRNKYEATARENMSRAVQRLKCGIILC